MIKHKNNLSLYLHFPWCIKKCPYCDFNSHTLQGSLPQDRYIAVMLDELARHTHLLKKRTITSIFLGGGTPSLFDGEHLQVLLQYCQTHCDLTPDIEITLEANPGTVEQQRFEHYRQAGINRLSLGVQSFDDQALVRLGRIHNANEAIQAADSARRAGFQNINLDLMFALPQQTTQQALQDLKTAIELKPQHLSWYQLTLEPNTLFHRFPPILPNDDESAEIQQQGQQLLSLHGYRQYEVSAYANSGYTCQHNLNYWQFGDYLGIGAGAHSKITSQPHIVKRHWNLKNPRDYMRQDQPYKDNESTIEGRNLLFEFLLNRFRLVNPIPEDELTLKTGYHFNDLQPELDSLVQKKLVQVNTHLTLTAKGRLFLNDVLQHWL